MANNRFHHSDAWIFLSLNNTGEATSLDNLVAKADWINHAIPTEAEVEDAINRLAQAGLVRVRNGKFFLTTSGKELYKTIHDKKRARILTLWEKLSKQLNTTDFPTLKVKDFELKAAELHEAYEKYHQRFQKIYEEMESKKRKKKSA